MNRRNCRRPLIGPIFSTICVVCSAFAVTSCNADHPLASSASSSTSSSSSSGGSSTSTEQSATLDASDDNAMNSDDAADDAGRDSSTSMMNDADATPPITDYDPPSLCPSAITLGSGTLLPFSTAGDDLGLSVTSDGLSAAWSTVLSNVVTVHYVDRASVGDAFSSEQMITGAFSAGRVALASDGLGLVVVNQDGLGFTYLTRVARSGSFMATMSPTPFDTLNAQGASDLQAANERYSNPVLAFSDNYFFFTRRSTSSTITYVTARDMSTQPFAGGAPFVPTALGLAGQDRVLTGVSADLRTLFVWDAIASRSRVVSLSASSAVTADVLLGTMRDVQTSADCTTFYFGEGTPADWYRFTKP